jgi:rare lipoprotein A
MLVDSGLSMPRSLPFLQRVLLVACALVVASCGTTPSGPAPSTATPAAPGAPAASSPSFPPLSSKYYKDDGPGEAPPANLDEIPDATPRLETPHRFANRPYTVLGRDYVPATVLRPYKERGVASWYGRKFHGQKTSNGETYDMYAMTAAHPTLPLPCYVRVTNVGTGKSVVVRVNDRGPFLHGRIIDLSYAAAHRIGIAARGSGEVEVEAIIPADGPVLAARAALPPVGTAPLRGPEPVEALPTSRDAPGGFAVQLGSFQNYVNAQAFLAHVQSQLATAQVEPKVREVNGLYRVFVGPYAEREEARRVADRIAASFGMATAIAPH